MQRLLVLCLLWISGMASAALHDVARDGDIIFHQSRSAQSLAIQQATRAKYSHMGIIFFQKGQPYVYEAAAKVSYTPLKAWIARGEKHHYVIKRLKDRPQLSQSDVEKLQVVATTFYGKPYDLVFAWSDQQIYCSELVWKIYDRALGIRIGELQKIRDFDLSSPAVKQKIRERYGDKLPLDEQVISPAAMFNSPLLVKVSEG